MKAFIAFVAALLAVFISGMEAMPAEDIPFPVEPEQVEVLTEMGGFQARITCDLMSGLGYNHAFCAAGCILKGKRGGYCDSNAVCNCRN